MFIKRKQENGVPGISIIILAQQHASYHHHWSRVFLLLLIFLFFFRTSLPDGWVTCWKLRWWWSSLMQRNPRHGDILLPAFCRLYLRFLFYFFLLKENLSTFLQSQTTGYTVASPFLLYEEVIEQHTLWCVVYTAPQTQKNCVFFSFFFLSFVE